MTVRHVAALDVSTTRIGFAAPDGTLVSIVSRFDAKAPVRRLDDLWRQMRRTLELHPPRPDVVIIEGYSLGKGPAGMLSKIRLGEVGAVARIMLFQLDIPYVEVPPTSLKRWATGKGNADKNAMIDAALRDGARCGRNDDEADAHHLRGMGRMAYGLDPMGEAHQVDAIAALTW